MSSFKNKANNISINITEAKNDIAEILSKNDVNQKNMMEFVKSIVDKIEKIKKEVSNADKSFDSEFFKIYNVYRKLPVKPEIRQEELKVLLSKVTSGLGGLKFAKNTPRPKISNMDNILSTFSDIVQKLQNNKKKSNTTAQLKSLNTELTKLKNRVSSNVESMPVNSLKEKIKRTFSNRNLPNNMNSNLKNEVLKVVYGGNIDNSYRKRLTNYMKNMELN